MTKEKKGYIKQSAKSACDSLSYFQMDGANNSSEAKLMDRLERLDSYNPKKDPGRQCGFFEQDPNLTSGNVEEQGGVTKQEADSNLDIKANSKAKLKSKSNPGNISGNDIIHQTATFFRGNSIPKLKSIAIIRSTLNSRAPDYDSENSNGSVDITEQAKIPYRTFLTNRHDRDSPIIAYMESRTSPLPFDPSQKTSAREFADENMMAAEDSDSSSGVGETIRSWAARENLGECGAGLISDVNLWREGDTGPWESVGDDGMVGDDSASEVDGFPRTVLRRTGSPSVASELSTTHAGHDTALDGAAVKSPEPAKVPDWFPDSVKLIYATDHHGGALTFKELSAVTYYRTIIEVVRRRKWKGYIEAGQARWKLQKIVHKLRNEDRISAKLLLGMRTRQYNNWKQEALRRWKKLEKYQIGALVLDDMINTNFLMERVIYKEKLNGRK